MSANETHRAYRPEAMAGNVRGLRVAGGISLDRLAESSGVGRSTLARLEAGQANPTIETLFAIADALRVPLGDLVEESARPSVYVQRAASAVRVAGDVEARFVDRMSPPGTAEILLIRI